MDEGETTSTAQFPAVRRHFGTVLQFLRTPLSTLHSLPLITHVRNMPRLKKYSEFCSSLLPMPPKEANDSLVAIFRPKKEPKVDNHFEATSAFEMWLQQPGIDPNRYPETIKHINSPLGTWIYICSAKWADRYDTRSMKAKLAKTAAQGALTSSLFVALGAVGIDGAIDTIKEAVAPAIALIARVGVPIPLESKEVRYRRMSDIMKKIKDSYK
jgi:hypothetical protein